MGCCKSKKKEQLTPEELERIKQQKEQEKQSLIIQETNEAKMKKHKQRILRRMSPPKIKPLSEEQLKNILGTIFREYSKEQPGVLSVQQFRDMLNTLNQRKTGAPNQYSISEVRQMMSKICGEGCHQLTFQDLYRIYKKL